MSVSSPSSGRKGLGRSGRLRGQSLVPPPPARITAYTRVSAPLSRGRLRKGDAALGRERCRLVRSFPGKIVVRPAEVAVRRGGPVDRPSQVERLDDARRPQIEQLGNRREDL